jgi:hypothetical protein
MTEIAEIRSNFCKLARMIPGPAACRRFHERVLTDPEFEAFSKYLPSSKLCSFAAGSGPVTLQKGNRSEY